MAKTWDEMTEQEREEYVNQDYCTIKHISVDVDSFDSQKYSMTPIYQDMCLDEYDLEGVFSHLSERQAEVLKLLFLEGLAQKIAAKKLGISRNSVKTHLARARVKLRKVYPKKEECSQYELGS